jgi:filamentous hemagglutinin family protein
MGTAIAKNDNFVDISIQINYRSVNTAFEETIVAMSQNQTCWQVPLQFLLIYVITFALPPSAAAQRIPVADDTLGNERSVVSPDQVIRDLPSNRIDGGARRGANLFHSFREFNVDAGRGAYFSNPDGVANILTRVTGNNRSDILGTLGVLGNANLFLLNPNGILFGKNSRLDVGGSFISSTADSFVFDQGFAFSATDPQAPPLLTVSAPIGLQYGNNNPGTIEMRADRLQVPMGQTLILAGGFIYVNNAEFYALGGRLELAGVAAPGQVGLTQQGQEWRLNLPDGLRRANILMENNGSANVRAAVGGSIIITARNFTIAGEGSRLRAGTFPGLGAVGAQAGDVTINATETVNFDGGFVLNLVLPDSVGNSGNININADVLSIANGGALLTQSQAIGEAGDININARIVSFINAGEASTATFRQGNAGDINITAREAVFIDGIDLVNENPLAASGPVSAVGTGAIGNGGNITINTGKLSITNGGFIFASTFGEGNAGNIDITARDVSFDGIGSNGVPGGAFGRVESEGVGRGGNIRINAGSLSIRNGAQVSVTTLGQGRAGTITFNTPTLTVASNARILAETSSTGNGGSIVVNAPDSVNLRRSNNLSPVLSVETSGAGQAGDITINTPSITLAERARITATATDTATNREGGGSITLNASNLNLAGIVGVFAETQGEAPAGTLRLNPYRNQPDLDITLTPNSQISASTSGSGRGGDLIVTAPQSITITGAGRLAVETSGTGNAGNMQFTTRQLSLQDGVEISASTIGTGQAGNIGINAEVFTLSDGAQVSTNTSGSGLAGDLTVAVKDQLFLTGQGTGLFASTASGSTGNGGNITSDPRLVQIEDGATVAVDSQGRGTGGNISLQVDDQLVLDQGSITAETNSAQGGNISLDVNDVVLLRNSSLISATAGTARAGGDGGNITIDGDFIAAVENENSDISANAFTGRGGNVQITTQGIFGIEARPQPTAQSDITASSERGVSGGVSINTPDADPSRGLVQLPVDLSDASQLITQACPTGDESANQFIVTGRGGLPPTPSEAVQRDAIEVDLVTVEEESLGQNQPSSPSSPSPDPPLTEAQGWQIAADGKVMLVAAVPQNTIAAFPNRLMHCQ